MRNLPRFSMTYFVLFFGIKYIIYFSHATNLKWYLFGKKEESSGELFLEVILRYDQQWPESFHHPYHSTADDSIGGSNRREAPAFYCPGQ